MPKLDVSKIADDFSKLRAMMDEDTAKNAILTVHGEALTSAGKSLDEALNEAKMAAFGDMGDLVGSLVSVQTFHEAQKREDMCPSFQKRLDVSRGFASSVYKTATWALQTIAKLKEQDFAEVEDAGGLMTPVEKVQTSGNPKKLAGVEASVPITEALLSSITGDDKVAYFEAVRDAFAVLLNGGFEAPSWVASDDEPEAEEVADDED